MKEILEQLKRIEMLLVLNKEIMNIEEASILTGLSKDRLYTLCSKREIPHYKNGKLYFKRNDLEAWMTQKKIESNQQVTSKVMLDTLRQAHGLI